MRIYDWKRGKSVKSYRGHASGILGLAFSPDNKTLASASTDTTVLMWDVAGIGK